MLGIEEMEETGLLNAQRQEVVNFDLSILKQDIHVDQSTKINFSEIEEDIASLQDMFKKISSRAICELSNNDMFVRQGFNKVENIFQRTVDVLNTIKDFQVPDGQISHTYRTNRVQVVQQIRKEAFDALFDLILYSSSVGTDTKKIESEIKQLLDSSKTQIDLELGKISGNVESSNNLLEEMKKVAAEQGVSQQAIHFKNEADSHNKQSKIWLGVTACLTLLLLICSVQSFYIGDSLFRPNEDGTIPWSLSIQWVSSKFLFFAFLSYALFLSAKNFLSHKHNSIINKHRQNSLLIFKELVEATSDDKSKDIILRFAASSIFAPQETGYTKSVQGGLPMNQPMIENIVRGVDGSGN